MLSILVSNMSRRHRFEHRGGPLEFGRGPGRDVPRQTISDPYISNDHLRIEEVDGDRLRLENLSQRFEVRLADGSLIRPGGVHECDLPARITLGGSLIEVERPGEEEGLDRATLRTVDRPYQTLDHGLSAPLAALGEAPSVAQLARWLETLVTVQRSAAGSPDFYAETARAVVELIGLDHGLVFLREGDDWEVVARHGAGSARETDFSRTILEQVAGERQTFYQVLADSPVHRSQVGGSAVVAAPVLCAEGRRVVGAIYGMRAPRADRVGVAIRPLEAQLVQVLAAAVGAGLARMESEAEARRRHRQFMDFFSPELTRALDLNPGLLDGERREVTVLFSDIRGFSRISEGLDPEDTCALVRDVMERLTRRIQAHHGVVVDYIGDAILALWNAPAEQPDHATLACRAALSMLEELPELNRDWAGRIGGPLGLGIGLNTGPALVGNTGSQSRFKYGPLGHTVNLASRVEGATKFFGVPVLITGETHARLGAHPFATRRLCRVQVVGIAAPADLYELYAPGLDPGWQHRRDAYEAGLGLFEAGAMAEAWRALNGLLGGQEGCFDRPTLHLLGRAVDHLKDPNRAFEPVLRLDAK